MHQNLGFTLESGLRDHSIPNFRLLLAFPPLGLVFFSYHYKSDFRRPDEVPGLTKVSCEGDVAMQHLAACGCIRLKTDFPAVENQLERGFRRHRFHALMRARLPSCRGPKRFQNPLQRAACARSAVWSWRGWITWGRATHTILSTVGRAIPCQRYRSRVRAYYPAPDLLAPVVAIRSSSFVMGFGVSGLREQHRAGSVQLGFGVGGDAG